MQQADSHHILLVDDNPGDAMLMQLALKKTQFAVTLDIANSGKAAISRLQAEGHVPDLILMDINLGDATGHDVLAVIRKNPRLAHIPVIMLSSSQADADVVKSYTQGANAYLVKPSDIGLLKELLTRTLQFWLELAILPENNSHK